MWIKSLDCSKPDVQTQDEVVTYLLPNKLNHIIQIEWRRFNYHLWRRLMWSINKDFIKLIFTVLVYSDSRDFSTSEDCFWIMFRFCNIFYPDFEDPRWQVSILALTFMEVCNLWLTELFYIKLVKYPWLEITFHGGKKIFISEELYLWKLKI